MAISIFDENENQFSTEYKPYDDTRDEFIRTQTNISASQGINTNAIDQFRQGVSITTEAHRFGGMAPKLWAGNIKSFSRIITYGQTPSWTEVKNKKFYEDQQEFNPVAFILDSDYPKPYVFNEGPQGARQAKIRAFVFPNWSDSNTDSEGTPIHELAARGNLEDGNQNISELRGSNSRISQFYVHNETNNILPFLEEGHRYFGEIGSEIGVDGYVNYGNSSIQPFNDIGNDVLINDLSTNDENLITILKTTSSLNLDNDIIGSYNTKASSAGHDTYGPDQAKYGADSIIYSGFYRGS